MTVLRDKISGGVSNKAMKTISQTRTIQPRFIDSNNPVVEKELRQTRPMT